MSRAKGRSKARQIGAAVVILLFGALAGNWLYITRMYPAAVGPGSGEEVVIDVPWGGSTSAVAQQAAEKGAVSSASQFAWYLKLSGTSRRLQAGRHLVADDWSPAKIAEALTGPGQAADVRVTLREGLSRFELGVELERRGITSRDAFLEATSDPALLARLDIPAESAEGYLFPETYRMEAGTAAARVVERLVKTFRQRTDPLFAEHSKVIADRGRLALDLEQELGRGPFHGRGLGPANQAEVGRHTTVILASMIEAETPLAHERPHVAAVLLNRLTSPEFHWRKLQIDPTVAYGCLAEPDGAPSCAESTSPLTKRHLEDAQNRYSTYAYPGLPPGPIGNPSLESIRAALAPADVDHLYFVASGSGGHVFSKTLEEHNAAVARYRARQDAGADGGGDAD